MDEILTRFTVFFENPFWVGVIEREINGKLSACKVTFGAEPKDGEIYEFLLKNYKNFQFSPAVAAEKASKQNVNPKKMQREIKDRLSSDGVGTKAQQALKLQYEQSKAEHKRMSSLHKEEEKERRFIQKQEKRLQKHKGH